MSNGSSRQVCLFGSKFSLTDIDFYTNVCFALSTIAAVSVNVTPTRAHPMLNQQVRCSCHNASGSFEISPTCCQVSRLS